MKGNVKHWPRIFLTIEHEQRFTMATEKGVRTWKKGGDKVGAIDIWVTTPKSLIHEFRSTNKICRL